MEVRGSVTSSGASLVLSICYRGTKLYNQLQADIRSFILLEQQISYAMAVTPSRELLKETTPWDWTDEIDIVFRELSICKPIIFLNTKTKEKCQQKSESTMFSHL